MSHSASEETNDITKACQMHIFLCKLEIKNSIKEGREGFAILSVI